MANPTIELLMARRSVRSFEERPVGRGTRDAVLAAALRAPTAGNMMLYSVIEVEDQGLKDKLAVSCDGQGFIAASPWVLVFLADYQRWMDYFELSGALGGEAAARPLESDLLLAFSDAFAAAQTAVVAAEALGLGSCYIGDVMENYELHRELLGLPRYAFPAAMLCLGYPTAQQRERPQPPRFDRRHVVFADRYERRSPEDFAQMFGGPFYAGASLLPGAGNYGQHVYRRKFAAGYSLEMRRSVRRALEEWK
ncbi:MAG TPA: nitroreductase family protein [Spirochaetales bacterium]|nr:nitroreductase family protein [Spirochaetales bacterium]HRY54213.1 nitroreductase family protein [Spirochaetia bacterium]HRZ64284.1 nitroreductase family protein [Spirochaetia bacterium]